MAEAITVDILEREDIIEQGRQYAKEANAACDGTNYYVDIDLANKVISFVSLLKHTDGKFAGVNFQLLPFQIKFLVDVICTKNRENNNRRYTTALLFIPKKNGKTELIAAVLNYFLFVDDEKGKELYCAANETEQAKIIYKATETMIKQNSTLSKKCRVYSSMREIRKAGVFNDFIKVLTSSVDTKDGLKPYIAVYDELHAAKDSSFFTILEDGMVNRDSPLFFIISTAGYNHQGIMKQKLEYAKKVRDGIIQDDSFYSMIFELTEEDLGEDNEGWKNEENWKKVNPALGRGVQLDKLRNKFIKALHSGEDEVAFKTKHLNIWTSAAKTWIKDNVWKASYHYDIDEAELIGRECFSGLDLSSTTDLTALVHLFPKEDGFDVLCRFWIPEDNIRERVRRDKVPYSTWVRDGHIMTTPGNVIDYAFIEETIKQDCEKFNVKELPYDPYNATSIITRLNDEEVTTLVPFRQGFLSMSPPTKEIETLILQKKLNHGNNPVLNWMCSNVALMRDPADNIKIDKAKSIEKVDGMVALAMALGRASVHQKEEGSVYETRGIRSV